MKILLSVWFLSLFLFECSLAQTKTFVIRVDDILSRNTSMTPRSILSFQDTVESRGGIVTWGVMPHRFIENANSDGELMSDLQTSLGRGHELSLHGYIHICQRCGLSSHEMYCTTHNSAFSYDQQLTLITDGLDLIHEYIDHRPFSFIPPGHISDETTWEVLADQQFTVLSTTVDEGWVNENVYNLPPNDEFTWALTESDYQDNLQAALSSIKETYEQQSVYVLLLHDPFIRLGYSNGITLRWMGALMDSLNQTYGDSLSYKTLTAAAEIRKGDLTSVESIATSSPSLFTLHQNYPNPFNPTTIIPFELQTPSQVRIDIYTLSGRLITTLTNQTYSSGYHELSVDATDWASGTYIYRMVTDGKGTTQRMVVVK